MPIHVRGFFFSRRLETCNLAGLTQEGSLLERRSCDSCPRPCMKMCRIRYIESNKFVRISFKWHQWRPSPDREGNGFNKRGHAHESRIEKHESDPAIRNMNNFTPSVRLLLKESVAGWSQALSIGQSHRPNKARTATSARCRSS